MRRKSGGARRKIGPWSGKPRDRWRRPRGPTDDEPIAHKSPAALTVCNATDRAALQQLAASIDIYDAWGSPGFDKGEVITIRGTGFTSLPAGTEVRWLSAVPNGRGTVDTFTSYAPASLNPHFPDIEISAVVPDHADGRGSLALIKRDTCKWFSGGQLVEGERHIALASFGWFDYVTERPAPSAPPPRVDPVRVLTVGPHFVIIVMPRMEETHAYRIEYRRAGAGAFQPYAIIGAGEPTYTVAGLQPQTTYEIRVVAFNSAGEAPPSDVLVATTTNINVEEEFVSLTVLDTSETEGPIDGIGSTFAARSAVVYWDDEADGCVNAQSEVVEEPGGFLYHLRPAPQNVVPWILLNGCDYDRNNNGAANLIVYALIDATPFARTGQQFVALHLRVDTSKNLVESVSMQAGDYALETGRVMWSAAIDPIQNVQLTLPGGGVNGRLSGSVTAALLFSEPMRSGGPAGSVVDHVALVRLDFDRVVIED